METAWKSKAVGIFDIVAGAFALFLGFVVGASLLRLTTPPPALGISLSMILVFLTILGVMAVAGGIFALRSKVWWLALAGSISASICMPPLGVPATLIVLFSRKTPKRRLMILILLGPLWLAIVGLMSVILLGYIS